ncbi:hypothetical protein [Lentibacillus saliphilus]|nr:hypothetical protein [Lentibacillus saliphilus]
MKGKSIILIILLVTVLALVLVYFIMEGIIDKYDLERAIGNVMDYKSIA